MVHLPCYSPFCRWGLGRAMVTNDLTYITRVFTFEKYKDGTFTLLFAVLPLGLGRAMVTNDLTLYFDLSLMKR